MLLAKRARHNVLRAYINSKDLAGLAVIIKDCLNDFELASQLKYITTCIGPTKRNA